MRHELAKCFLDALGACRAICEFTGGITFDRYKNDLLVRSAVERQFEILGEAFGRIDGLDTTIRKQMPEIGSINADHADDAEESGTTKHAEYTKEEALPGLGWILYWFKRTRPFNKCGFQVLFLIFIVIPSGGPLRAEVEGSHPSIHNPRSLDYARDDGNVAMKPKRNKPGRYFMDRIRLTTRS